MRILVIDNYDSFVYNLVQYLGQLGAECDVRRNDEIDAGRGRPVGFDGRAALPRAGHARAGRHLPRRDPRRTPARLPIFGVCLGHQAHRRWRSARP